jgi:hypothetical protein
MDFTGPKSAASAGAVETALTPAAMSKAISQAIFDETFLYIAKPLNVIN